MINLDDEEIDSNLQGWKVTAYDSKSIEITLQFEKPELVS